MQSGVPENPHRDDQLDYDNDNDNDATVPMEPRMNGSKPKRNLRIMG